MDPNFPNYFLVIPPLDQVDQFYENDGNLPFRLREQSSRFNRPLETLEERPNPGEIYLVKDEAFVFTADPELKQKKSYRSDILYNWNRNDSASCSSDEKPRFLKMLQKVVGTNFPLDMQCTAPFSLVRYYSAVYQNDVVGFEANLGDELFKRLREVMTDITLTATLKINDDEYHVEMKLKTEDVSITKVIFNRKLNRIAGKTLKNGENVEGLLSVKLAGEVLEKLSDRYDGINLGARLLEDKSLADCILTSADGCMIGCHQLILKLHSSEFSSMLDSDSQESEIGEIRLETMTEEGLVALKKYMYCWDLAEVQKSVPIAVQMLSTAHFYKMKDLEEAIVPLFGAKRSLQEQKQWYMTAKGISIKKILNLFAFANDMGESYRCVMTACAFMLKCHQNDLEQSEEVADFLARKPKMGARLLSMFVKDFDQM